MVIRLSPVVLALALGCSASAPGGTVNTASDSGTSPAANDAAASGGTSLDTVCASICTGSGESCGAGCVQRCQAGSAIAPACAESYLALMRCADANGYRCPSATMATPPPAACSAQAAAWTPCFAAAVRPDASAQ